MKKIFKYMLLLILVIIVVKIFVYFLTKPYYKDMDNYQILVKSPNIEITESKIDKSKGYIQGNVTNDTGEIIHNFALKFDFYNDTDRYLGSEYYKMDTFNVREKSKFDIKYKYNHVCKIVISIVNNKNIDK